jgi:hypothetical protein
MKDIECPYCGFEQDVNHDDGYGYDENEKYQQECEKCKKTFIYTTTISFYHEADKADCLNGSSHDFKQTHTFPKQFIKMECSMCGERRNPTKEEMEIILSE